MALELPIYRKYEDKVHQTLYACILDYRKAFVVRICSKSNDTDVYIYHNEHFVDLLLYSDDSSPSTKKEFWTKHADVMESFGQIFAEQYPNQK